MKNLKSLLVLFLTFIPFACSAEWATYYKIINAVNEPLDVGVWQLVGPAASEVGHFEPLMPGEIRTVKTNAANCLDQIWIRNKKDGKDWRNIGGGICAGSVACITDEAGYIHPLAKPYYGQKNKDMPCDPSNIGAAVGISAGTATGIAAGNVAMGAAAGAATAAAAGATAGAIGGALAAVPPAAIGVAVAAGSALAGCGMADLAVLSGFCKGSAGTFSAEDWQRDDSTMEARQNENPEEVKKKLTTIHNAMQDMAEKIKNAAATKK